MEIRNVSTSTQYKTPVQFGSQQTKPEQREYVSRRAASSVATGALFGNILGGYLIGLPAAKAILKSPVTRDALKTIPPLRMLGASVAILMSSAIPGFLAAKFMANRNQPDEAKLKDKTLLKLTAASIAGTAMGSAVGNKLMMMMQPGILPMIASAIITVLGNDTAVNWMAKQHNKKAAPPQMNFIVSNSGVVNGNEFEYFIMRTKGSRL